MQLNPWNKFLEVKLLGQRTCSLHFDTYCQTDLQKVSKKVHFHCLIKSTLVYTPFPATIPIIILASIKVKIFIFLNVNFCITEVSFYVFICHFLFLTDTLSTYILSLFFIPFGCLLFSNLYTRASWWIYDANTFPRFPCIFVNDVLIFMYPKSSIFS